MRFSQSNEKIWSMCYDADFTRVWDPLTCWLSRGVLTWCFLKSGLTKSFTVCNFQKKVAMTIIFFFKMFEIWSRFQKWTKQWEKVFGLKDNCIWIENDKFSQSRTGYLSVEVNMLRNTATIYHGTKGIFCKSGSLRVMKKYYGNALLQILYKFGTLNKLTVKGYSETVFFREWSIQVFQSLCLPK